MNISTNNLNNILVKCLSFSTWIDTAKPVLKDFDKFTNFVIPIFHLQFNEIGIKNKFMQTTIPFLYSAENE